jgi:hypothetical protein
MYARTSVIRSWPGRRQAHADGDCHRAQKLHLPPGPVGAKHLFLTVLTNDGLQSKEALREWPVPS